MMPRCCASGWETARSVVVIGAGFIGLEFAAVARSFGCQTHVIEAAARPLARALSMQMSEFFADAHRALGVDLRLDTGVARLIGQGGRITGVELSDASVLPTDLVLIGIGVLPDMGLATEAGIGCGNGILVDARLATSAPHVSAIGDAVFYDNPFAGGPVRLESVQNAVDQAKCLAAGLAGRPADYRAVPWFWSDQADLKLQIVGVAPGAGIDVVRGDVATRAFSVFCFRAGRLAAVESVNRAGDHMAARRIIAAGLPITPEAAADPDFDLKALAQSGR